MVTGFDTFFKNLSTFLIIAALVMALALILFVAGKKAFSTFIAIKAAGLKLKLSFRVAGLAVGSFLFWRVYSPLEEEGHMIVFGASGSGKTSTILIPTLRAWNIGTFFSIDISGDIEPNIKRPDKLVFEPLNKNTVPYNVFADVDNPQGEYFTSEEKIMLQNDELEKIALALKPQKAVSDGAVYYEDGARDILKASLIAFYHQGLDFLPVCRLIHKSDYRTLFEKIDASGNPDAMALLTQFVGGDDKWKAGCMQEAQKAVAVFAKGIIGNSFRRPSGNETAITPATLETHSVFMCIPSSDLELYQNMVSVVVNQIISYLMRRTKYNVPATFNNNILIVIDEFGSFKNIADMAAPLREIRKHHARIMLVLQSLSRLDVNYGNNVRDDMLNNVDLHVVGRLNDPTIEEYYSKKSEMVPLTLNKRGTNPNNTAVRKFRPIQFERLRKHVIVFKGGYCCKLRQHPYYKGKQPTAEVSLPRVPRHKRQIIKPKKR